jgi:hypothetical protein
MNVFISKTLEKQLDDTKNQQLLSQLLYIYPANELCKTSLLFR